jgi:hypothetical protein
MCGVQPRIRNVDSQFGQPRNCDKVVTIILCGSGSYHNFLARNDVWRVVFWIAVVEALLFVLPIELAGIAALIRVFFSGG